MTDRPALIVAWTNFLGTTDASNTAGALADISTLQVYSPGQHMLQQGRTDEGVLLVVSGRGRQAHVTRNGHEIWLEDILPGMLSGQAVALSENPTLAQVVAVEASSAVTVAAQPFVEMVRTDPVLSSRVCDTLAVRTTIVSDLLIDNISMTVNERLRSLIALNGERHEDDQELVTWNPVLPVSELAIRVHATREATSRAIRLLKARGLLRVKGKAWTVVAPQAVGTLPPPEASS